MNRKYKDSGIEWIGKIPYNWIYGGLTKFVSSIIDYRGKTPEKVESGVFLVTAKNIKNGEIDYSISKEYVKKEDYKEIMRRGLPVIGDVLFTTEAPLGQVANVDDANIALAQRIIKFRGKKNVLNNYYLKYWISSSGFQYYLQTFATGSTAMGIKASKLSKLIVLLPPFNDQKEIVDFLNEKTFEIDSLIAAKKKLIALLEEQRQAIITEAVTKGLDPNVKMKDSGVEWIGEIPEHWNLLRIKYLGDAILGLTYSPSDVVSKNEGKLVLRSSNIRNGKIDYNDTVYVNCAVPPKLITKEHDILICSRNGSRELIGKCALIDRNSQDQTFGAFTTVFRSEINEFLFYIFQSQLFKSQIGSYLTSTINQLTISKLRNFPVAIPNDLERKKITNFLQKKALEFDSIIKNEKNAIDNLKEYRQSLIYEAVTGKIDVRDYKKEEALS
ncbi:restriction endonuclease subunit S [Sporolactobacillus sp. CQH2019]|uniref:restriction endonuclease subunit S n=1 Tax=Sporolactobacillus sp. CQH2019 TaxID=3023512 RepID=UPI002367ECC8|nr:restriction endonuclease subunit S [Sporolactobacillus sp. CQH2019]MDD9149758.1 restriction endonuclease subunit S [Sporolactobacillus sp. CQH2019]